MTVPRELSWDDGRTPPYGTDRCANCDHYIVFGADGWELWNEPGVTVCDDVDLPAGTRHEPEPMTGSELIADHCGRIELTS
jgi:hypothetical protein